MTMEKANELQPRTSSACDEKDDHIDIGVHDERVGTATDYKLKSEAYEVDSNAENIAEADIMAKRLGGDLGVTEKDIEYMLNVVDNMSTEEAVQILEEALVVHEHDRNFPAHSLSTIRTMLADYHGGIQDIEGVDNEFAMKTEAALIHYNSPYPEVRAVVDPYDDYDEPCETLRAYVLGSIWVIVGTGVNQFFEVRMPKIGIPATLFQLVLIPCGWVWATIIPDWGFTLRGKRYSLNPGPWTYKEQMLATIMFNITASLAYADFQIIVQKLDYFYGNKWANVGYQFLLTLSNQFLGFGIAGLLRSILVYPSYNIWFANFPTLALNRALMQPNNKVPANGWTMAPYTFFGICFIGMFFYQWLPTYLLPFLSVFNWMTWIAPNNFSLAAITGSADGLGVNPLSTLDWSVIDTSAPLVTPFFSMVNLFAGAMIAGCVLIPAVYYSNMYYTAYLPINTSRLYTNTGEPYEVQKILTDNLFDAEKYQKYSPPYYTAANLVLYGSFFAGYTCIFVRCLLYDWRIMYEGYKELVLACIGRGKGISGFNDQHSRIMQRYKEAPMWWYLVVLLCALALGIALVKTYPLDTPVWGIFFAIGLSIVFLVPIGQLYAQTNQMFTINVLTELIAGYALPGRGTAMMTIKAFGVNTNMQAMYFMSDLKLGHYTKVPPRATFRCQIIATLISSIVMIGVVDWQMGKYPDLCQPSQAKTTKFTCPDQTVYFSSSVIWGVIGPKRIFDSQYPVLKYCFLIGALIPIPFWAFDVYWSKVSNTLGSTIENARDRNLSPLQTTWYRFLSALCRSLNKLHDWNKFLDLNIMIMGVLNFFAPYNLSYIWVGFYVNVIFMKWIRTRYLAWFEKYLYVMSAAFSAGMALATLIIFFALQYKGIELNWWGSLVSFNGLDGSAAALKTLAPGEVFGPKPGRYHV